jgi:hypothetical protein
VERAGCLLDLGQTTLAELLLEEALERDPRHAAARTLLERAQCSAGRAQPAMS